MYEHIWKATIGEELDCRREPDHPNDRYAVAVVKRETVVAIGTCREGYHVFSCY